MRGARCVSRPSRACIAWSDRLSMAQCSAPGAPNAPDRDTPPRSLRHLPRLQAAAPVQAQAQVQAGQWVLGSQRAGSAVRVVRRSLHSARVHMCRWRMQVAQSSSRRSLHRAPESTPRCAAHREPPRPARPLTTDCTPGGCSARNTDCQTARLPDRQTPAQGAHLTTDSGPAPVALRPPLAGLPTDCGLR